MICCRIAASIACEDGLRWTFKTEFAVWTGRRHATTSICFFRDVSDDWCDRTAELWWHTFKKIPRSLTIRSRRSSVNIAWDNYWQTSTEFAGQWLVRKLTDQTKTLSFSIFDWRFYFRGKLTPSQDLPSISKVYIRVTVSPIFSRKVQRKTPQNQTWGLR